MHLTNKFVSEIESEAGFLEKWKKGEKGGAAERSIPGAFRLAAPKIEINSREPGATIIIYYGMVLLSDGGVAATPYHGEIANKKNETWSSWGQSSC